MFDKDTVKLLRTIRIEISAPGPHDQQRVYVIGASVRTPGGRWLEAANIVPENDFDSADEPAALLGVAAGVAITKLLQRSKKLTAQQETQNA